jgi:hypothetical protein
MNKFLKMDDGRYVFFSKDKDNMISLIVEDGARLDGNVKKVPLSKIENKVTNFLDTTKAVRKTFLTKKD